MFCFQECGITYYQNNVKIVGGVVATENSWPAQAYVKSCALPGLCYLCGGTLIDLSTVLTAAHCFDTTDPTAFTVFLGKLKSIFCVS